MGKTKVLKLENEVYFLNRMTASENIEKKEKQARTCGLSKELIKTGDQITLIANNFKYFPNKLVLTKYLEDLGEEHSVLYLKKRYEEYKRFQEEYSEWIDF